jgi:hypothetical protein
MLSMIAFLALVLWRFVFDIQRSVAVKETGEGRHRRRNPLESGFGILDWTDTAVMIRNRFDGGSDAADLVNRDERARAYLRRVVALTGATQIGNSYVLNIGKTQFSVRDGYVKRLWDTTDPKCRYEETCFYCTNKEVPKAEQIATALLQLRDNPALFDGWADQQGLAFKADGQIFTYG